MNRLFPSVLTMSVRSSWVFAVFLSGVALLFSGCGDSSDVGLGVGPDSLEGGQPVTFNINPELDTTRLVPQTGRDLTPSLGGSAPTWRFLVGRVDDPLTGGSATEAEGYMDVSPPSSLPDRISSADPDSIAAELRLSPTYVHGDTTSSVDIEVRELEENAEMDRARADTSFPVGSFATNGPVSVSPNPDDSLVTIGLSDAWVEDRLDDLQQDSLDAFFGFKLTTGSSEDAVIGFSAGSASLRLTHRGDSTTADYNALKVFTHVEQTGPPASPPDTASHRLLQDGVGTGLEMRWSFDEPLLDTLDSDPLNRAQIFVPVDTTAMKAAAGPQTFVRPSSPKGFRVIATVGCARRRRGAQRDCVPNFRSVIPAHPERPASRVRGRSALHCRSGEHLWKPPIHDSARTADHPSDPRCHGGRGSGAAPGYTDCDAALV
ncbi:MAG: hypothetical protein BRD51_03485 [Bacteroidetes bacterium SW_11_64_17]|nr:MAG: hypothetical protein BRD51_03485 [Bacteroidetes bacterium SW_11_64_17]